MRWNVARGSHLSAIFARHLSAEFDLLPAANGVKPSGAPCDDSLRSNALIAVALGSCRCRWAVQRCWRRAIIWWFREP